MMGSIDSPVAFDRLAGALHQLVECPVVDGYSDDRALQESAPLEPIQRSERHHFCQVAGNPEDDEDVGDALIRAVGLAAYRRGLALDRRCHCYLLGVIDPVLTGLLDLQNSA